jgi:hypothetical protein
MCTRSPRTEPSASASICSRMSQYPLSAGKSMRVIMASAKLSIRPSGWRRSEGPQRDRCTKQNSRFHRPQHNADRFRSVNTKTPGRSVGRVLS